MRLSAENLALTPENTIHPLKQTYRHKTTGTRRRATEKCALQHPRSPYQIGRIRRQWRTFAPKPLRQERSVSLVYGWNLT